MLRGAVGGALVGLSASLLLVLNGRVAGISGIVHALTQPVRGLELSWRAWFVLGLVAGGLGAAAMLPHAEVTSPSLLVSVVAGALVGVGTRLGNGCTSGHGVCGLSRLSGRSLVATLTFITTGAIAVLVMRGLGAGEAP
ncbi:MAG: YeeE/YedE family protein [Deltaproteobacteria bacterium]|jgi:uncharacterized membrane protein YedE/YeeE